MTFFSLNNYKNHLVKVNSISVNEMNIDHEAEYVANLYEERDSYYLKWKMTDYIESIQDDMENNGEPLAINACNIIYNFSINAREKLQVKTTEGEMTEGYIDSVLQKEGYCEVQSKISHKPDSWKLGDTYKVKLSFIGTKKKYVLPSTSIFKENGDSYIYIIDTTQKVWGEEYSIRKMPVKVVESNGEYSAINAKPGSMIVEVVKDNYYNGMLVDIK